jgi:hypothetical protein
MQNFLVGIEKNDSGAYIAWFADGKDVELSADTYADALCEADTMLSN